MRLFIALAILATPSLAAAASEDNRGRKRRLCEYYETAEALEKSIHEDLPAIESASQLLGEHAPRIAALLPTREEIAGWVPALDTERPEEDSDHDRYDRDAGLRLEDCGGEGEERICTVVALGARYATFTHCDLPYIIQDCGDLDTSFALIEMACLTVTLDPDVPQRQEIAFCSMNVAFSDLDDEAPVFDKENAESIDYVVMRPQGTRININRSESRISVDGFWYRPPVKITRIYDFSEEETVQYNQGHPCTAGANDNVDFDGRTFTAKMRGQTRALEGLIEPIMRLLRPVVGAAPRK